jgi:hypothetical protein
MPEGRFSVCVAFRKRHMEMGMTLSSVRLFGEVQQGDERQAGGNECNDAFR